MVTPGGGALDIGTDHAYIPIYLAERGIKEKILACDINKGPLAIAQGNIRAKGLEKKIAVCLSDGLEKTEISPGDSVIIAGMGGLLIRDILLRSDNKAKVAGELILQPQTEYSELRMYLSSTGFEITNEDMVEEDGKYYFVIRAVPSGKGAYDLSDAERDFGPVLLKKQHPLLREYLEKRLGTCREVLSRLEDAKPAENIIKRMNEIKSEINYIEEIIMRYFGMPDGR